MDAPLSEQINPEEWEQLARAGPRVMADYRGAVGHEGAMRLFDAFLNWLEDSRAASSVMKEAAAYLAQLPVTERDNAFTVFDSMLRTAGESCPLRLKEAAVPAALQFAYRIGKLRDLAARP